jgi:hypothetical protein
VSALKRNLRTRTEDKRGAEKMKNKIMLSVIKDGQIDCPQDQSEVYFDTLEDARNKGLELLKRFSCDVFVARLLTTGIGHYRTLGYFNSKNEYLR